MNPILATDSYKASHYLQYPTGTEGMFSYLESRGGLYDRTLFFGLQYIIDKYLTKPVTHADVDEAAKFFAAHGTPFPETGWRKIVTKHNGHIPVRIRAVAEGMVIPTHNVLMTVESLDPECFWVVTWIETLLMRLWYPITVATQSWHLRNLIQRYLTKTSDNIAGVDFKLHDFGGRGVSSGESAGLGGAAHLAAGWQGSDTIEGILLANKHYDCDMAAFSIPASEHSTITTWGPEREHEAFENMLLKFGGEGKVVACVSDSYDIYKAVDYWISRSDQIRQMVGTLVIRPDSGDPLSVLLAIMEKFNQAGLLKFNNKGYLVLPDHFRIIQGDGVNPKSIEDILEEFNDRLYSTDSLAFGMGGALLQKVDRDTQKFAYKCSAVKIKGQWVDVYKDPVTDPGKKSKRGRLDLVGCLDDGFQTVKLEGSVTWNSMLCTVYEGMPYLKTPRNTLQQVRLRATRCAK